MNVLLQAIVASGALGYWNLNHLQNSGKYSSMMPKEHTNSVRVLFGLYYFLVMTLAVSFVPSSFAKWGIVLIQISSMIISAIVANVFVSIWLAHRDTGDRHDLTARERAFSQYDSGGYTQVDIFTIDGAHVASGLLNNYNALAGVPNDVVLSTLPSGYRALNTIEEAEADSIHQSVYLDTQTGLKYYITFWEPEKA